MEQQRIQRLIQIAKPLEFSIGKNFNEKTPTEQTKSEVTTKKQQLPMIGKRNQFSKFKTITAMPIKPALPKPAKAEKLLGSDEEEIEEDDEKPITETERSVEKTADSTPAEIENATETAKELPNEELEKIQDLEKSNECSETNKDTSNYKDSSESNTSGGSAKKKRHRTHRSRGAAKRQDVDDEDYEASEKYAKWLPPENQTGDGFTKLNEKFGY